jgi:hypothetical protein
LKKYDSFQKISDIHQFFFGQIKVPKPHISLKEAISIDRFVNPESLDGKLNKSL